MKDQRGQSEEVAQKVWSAIVGADIDDPYVAVAADKIGAKALDLRIIAMMTKPGGDYRKAWIKAYGFAQKQRGHTLPALPLAPERAAEARKRLRRRLYQDCKKERSQESVRFRRLEIARLTDKDLDQILAALYLG
ncbi:hypothetical protein [Nitrospira sp. Nam74]